MSENQELPSQETITTEDIRGLKSLIELAESNQPSEIIEALEKSFKK